MEREYTNAKELADWILGLCKDWHEELENMPHIEDEMYRSQLNKLLENIQAICDAADEVVDYTEEKLGYWNDWDEEDE